jgi:hypothetical protein
MDGIKGSAENAYLCDGITRGLDEERGRAGNSGFQRRRVQRRLVTLANGEQHLLREYEVTST